MPVPSLASDATEACSWHHHHHAGPLDGDEHICPHQESLPCGHWYPAAVNRPPAGLVHLGGTDRFRMVHESLNLAWTPVTLHS